MMHRHNFGGDWTNEKLLRLKKYLVAYATIMNKQSFRFAFIDAFAGTGYRTLSNEENGLQLAMPELRFSTRSQTPFGQRLFEERNVMMLCFPSIISELTAR